MPAVLPATTKFVYVSGKGGTGKSFVASLLARGLALRGEKPVVVETQARRRSAGSGNDGSPAEFRRVIIDEEAALTDFLSAVLGLRFVAERLMRSRSFSAVAGAAPGIKDLVTLWSIAKLGSPRQGAGLVVIDAPSSGHSVPLLSSPLRTLEIVGAGPVARTARRLAAWVRDPARFSVLLVANPEELCVREARLLHGQLRESGIALAPVLINGVYPKRADDAQSVWLSSKLDRLGSPELALYLDQRRRHLEFVGGVRESYGEVLTLPFLFGGQGAATPVLAEELVEALFGERE